MSKSVADPTNTNHPNPGNRIFSRIVVKNRSIFQTLQDAKHKQLSVISIVMAWSFVKSNGKEGWVEVSRMEAYRMTADALRKNGQAESPTKRRPVFETLDANEKQEQRILSHGMKMTPFFLLQKTTALQQAKEDAAFTKVVVMS
jgi:hypothetical protein